MKYIYLSNRQQFVELTIINSKPPFPFERQDDKSLIIYFVIKQNNKLKKKTINDLKKLKYTLFIFLIFFPVAFYINHDSHHIF